MSQSNNTSGSDKTRSELSSTESKTVDYSQECNTINEPVVGLTSNTKIRKKEFLMSEDAFLELIPVNGCLLYTSPSPRD